MRAWILCAGIILHLSQPVFADDPDVRIHKNGITVSLPSLELKLEPLILVFVKNIVVEIANLEIEAQTISDSPHLFVQSHRFKITMDEVRVRDAGLQIIQTACRDIAIDLVDQKDLYFNALLEVKFEGLSSIQLSLVDADFNIASDFNQKSQVGSCSGILRENNPFLGVVVSQTLKRSLPLIDSALRQGLLNQVLKRITMKSH